MATPDRAGLLPVKAAGRQGGGSGWGMSRVLLVSLPYTTSVTLQNEAAHAQCPWPEAETV